MDCPSGRSDTGRRLSLWTQFTRRPQALDSSRGAATQRVKRERCPIELSAGAGFTHHLQNPDTDDQNGVDVHLDRGASRFLSEHWHVGDV